MIRMIGAALVVLSSGAVGFGFARAVKLQCAQLEGLLWALDTMQSEMSARLTPLAQLFSGLSACRQKDVAAFFAEAGRALSAQPYCTVLDGTGSGRTWFNNSPMKESTRIIPNCFKYL